MARVLISGAGIFKGINENSDVQVTFNQINDVLFKRIIEDTISFTDELGPRYAELISKNATKSLRGLLPAVASMFGRFSGAKDKTLTAFNFGIRGQSQSFGLTGLQGSVNVTWSALNKNYLNRKQKKANPTFFKLTGELQQFFLDQTNAAAFANKLGNVQAVYVPYNADQLANSKRDFRGTALKPMGNIVVSMTPSRSVSPGRFRGSLEEGIVNTSDASIFNLRGAQRFDEIMFREHEEVVRKLTNKQSKRARRGSGQFYRTYRPVVQPATAIWLLQKIPQAVNQTLKGIGSTK